jgi:hypothetical protein
VTIRNCYLLQTNTRSLSIGCGQIDSCKLVSTDPLRPTTMALVAGQSQANVVPPGEYTMECTTSGGMCLLDFDGLAQQGCNEATEEKHCNDQPICTNWSSTRNGNRLKITQCKAKSVKVTGKIWMQSFPCDEEIFEIHGECPPIPEDECTTVDFACAKCGQVLECYIDAPTTSSEYNKTKTYIQSSKFCNGFKTTCGGQQCAMQQGLAVYPATIIDRQCPLLGTFQCKAGAGKGKGAGLSNWATYQYERCDRIVSLECSEKCDSGKACGCEYGASTFCAKC